MNVGAEGRDGVWDGPADRRGGRLLRRGGGWLVGPVGDAYHGDLGIYRPRVE
jgi:hypothetical protein